MYTRIQPAHPPHALIKALALAVALGPAASLTASAYQLIDLGVGVLPTDINNNGTVVGSRQDGTAKIAIRIPSGGNIEDLVGGIVANAVNDNELVTGNTLTGAFLYDGTLQDIGDDYTGGDINALGQIAGSKAGTNPFRSSLRPVTLRSTTLTARNGKCWRWRRSIRVAPARASTRTSIISSGSTMPVLR